MSNDLPKQVEESDLDDTQSTDIDIDDLYQRFIVPIELKRSMSAPNLFITARVRNAKDNTTQISPTDLNNAHVDNNFPQESRASAFYRMIGLPVMDAGFGFYNPGFNPARSANARTKNATIGDNPDQNILKMQISRERYAKQRAQMFQSYFLNSSVFEIGQLFTKKFKIIKAGKFNDYDPQSFDVLQRQAYISDSYEQANGDPIEDFQSSNTHILKPFLVNAIIERTVMPANRQICEPFLKTKKDTLLEKNVYLDRPGIEFILRIRLQQDPGSDLLSNIISGVDPSQDLGGISKADLSRIMFALFDQKNVDVSEAVQTIGANNTEILTVNNLIKLIKSLVYRLVASVNALAEVILKIDWTPLPGTLGPEDSQKLIISNKYVKLKKSTSELEQRINELKIKSAIAQTATVPSSGDIGNFAFSYFEQTQKLYDDNLNAANEEKHNYINKGAQALRDIEIITGEVSGLGLVDILAIYTALWAIDLDVLVSLLDADAFDRLVKNNKELKNTNVQNRINNNNKPVVSFGDAMQKLEDKIVNILSFADSTFDAAMATPIITEGGSSPEG